MNIVIPSYIPHLEYNVNFLKSFDLHCLDKKDVNIFFIVSKIDKEHYKKLENYGKNINIIIFEDLLKFYIKDEILFINKYPIQSLKKLLSYQYLKDDYIVIDSENLCLKDFNMKDIFFDIKNKDIIYTNTIVSPIQDEVINNCSFILKSRISKWFFLKSYWYYEFEYVEFLMDYIKENSETLQILNRTIFDYQLYCHFIEINNLKKISMIDDMLSDKVLNKFKADNNNYEYFCRSIDDNNIDEYCDLIKKEDERIVRLHWMSSEHKEYILKNTNVCIGTFHW